MVEQLEKLIDRMKQNIAEAEQNLAKAEQNLAKAEQRVIDTCNQITAAQMQVKRSQEILFKLRKN